MFAGTPSASKRQRHAIPLEYSGRSRCEGLAGGRQVPMFRLGQSSPRRPNMSYSGSGNTGGAPPHAFDPYLEPELFRGVLTRRVFAFLIELVVLSIPVVLGYAFIAVFGLITLGLGWVLFWLAWPASVIWAIVYYGASLGGPHSATLGMRAMDLELRTFYGAPGYFVLGAMHAVLFWVSVSFLSPLVVLVGLFNSRRRLLHDIVLGTVVINNSVRSPVGQPARTF